MPPDLTRYYQLKQSVEQKRREFDRAVGALSELEKRLSSKFGVNSIEEGLSKLNNLKEKLQACQNQLLPAMKEVEDKLNQYGTSRQIQT
jgi:hypothetical protein